jgi:[ribosomal protein S5]-alanine N-acetyltransferase
VALRIQTQRLVVREFDEDDVPELARAFVDPEVIWWDPEPFTPEKARAWVAKARDGYRSTGCGLYALELRAGGRLIGDCGLVTQRLEGEQLVEIGWHLERTAWGRGYATEAARAVLEHAVELGLRRVCSLIVPGNERSRRVAQKLGMTIMRQVEHGGLPHDLWELELPA